MPNFQRAFILFCCCFLCGNISLAQKKFIVLGESNVKIEAHLSENETKEKAIELAKLDALINKFGQYAEQESELILQSGKSDFRSYGQIKVKGEWIRTIGEPEFSYSTRTIEGHIIERWVRCKIKGEVREAMPKITIEVETLSCPQKACRTSEFISGENMFLFVKSPVNGYLSIFLDDGTSVFQLLPYRNSSNQKSVRICSDQEYILFSRDILYFDTSSDAIELFTQQEKEFNYLTIVFSENDFVKPLLNNEKIDNDGYIFPRSLSKNKFEEWLGENRALSSGFVDVKKQIIIIAR